MGRLRGDRGGAHPMQSHLAQERRDASPSFRGQQGPDRRRQIAHRGIQANAPGRIALRSRFSAIRPAPSIYERHHEWDIEFVFITLNATFTVGNVTVTAKALIEFAKGEDPYFENLDPT